MNLENLINKYIDIGYSPDSAAAKICQEIILNKIAKSSFYKNVTIKGGVVMHSISKNMRRATRDLDLDFIKYSLENESIKLFIDKLNMINDGVKLKVIEPIKTLKHQNYSGKRVIIELIDNNNFSIITKLDIGVHKYFNITQDEYCFNLDAIDESANLLINSKEQILVEKLLSLLKIGPASTRYKDLFDFYYLINYTKLDINKVQKFIDILIYQNNDVPETNIESIIVRLTFILNSPIFKKHLTSVKVNWLDIPVNEVIKNVLDYFNSINVVKN